MQSSMFYLFTLWSQILQPNTQYRPKVQCSHCSLASYPILSVAQIILTEKARCSYKGEKKFRSYSLFPFLWFIFFLPCSLFLSFSSSPASQVMQFGRIDGNAYILDFQYPFSAVQAFAVALANVTQRLK